VRICLLLGHCPQREQHLRHRLRVARAESIEQQALDDFALQQALVQDGLDHFVQLLLEGGTRVAQPFDHHGQQHRVHVEFEEQRILALESYQVGDAVQNRLEQTRLELHQVIQLHEQLHGDQVRVDEGLFALLPDARADEFHRQFTLLEVGAEEGLHLFFR